MTTATLATEQRVLAPVTGKCGEEEGAFGIVKGRDGDMVLVIFPDEPMIPVYAGGEGKRQTGTTLDWRWVNEAEVTYL